MATADKFSVICKDDGEVEITLYDVIDGFWGISATSIYDALQAQKNVNQIRVRINSPGGSVFEGMAIYNLLKSHKARKIVNVDGIAASMASVIAMIGDEIEMGEGAFLMIHNPLTRTSGNAEDLRDMAEVLDKMKASIVGIYARRTGQDEDTVSKWMDDETWLTASEAVEKKFADRTVAGLNVKAEVPTGFYNMVPKALQPKTPKEEKPMAEAKIEPKPATYAELAAICGKDAEFICGQLESGATIDHAAAAWSAHLKTQLDAARVEVAAAKAEAAEAKAKLARPGVEPIGGMPAASGHGSDPIAAFQDAVSVKVKAGATKAKATASVVRENPELHAAYLAAKNK